MKTKTTTNTGSPALMAGTVLIMLAGTLACTTCGVSEARRRAALAESISNAKQVKYALDMFAMDHDGAYPNSETAKDYKISVDGSSNGYFRQLFMEGITQSEQIFWVKGASVCNTKKPDDVITNAGQPDEGEILKPGDCGWAYMTEQTNKSHPARPLIMDAYKVGTKEFDFDLWGSKRNMVIVLRIDSSAQPLRIQPAGAAAGKVLDRDQMDILSRESKAWEESTENPRELLLQPKPS